MGILLSMIDCDIKDKSKSIKILETFATVPLLDTTLFISNISSKPVLIDDVVPPE